jgi:hypothetical protein
MPLLFSRKAKLTRQAILLLATLDPETLRPLIGQLRVDGMLPRSWRRQIDGWQARTISLPLPGPPMAQALLRRLGRPWLLEFSEIIQEVLADARTNTHVPGQNGKHR